MQFWRWIQRVRGALGIRVMNCIIQSLTMELAARDGIPEWGGPEILMGIEQDVVFTTEAAAPLMDARQHSI
jgi:hypothetical protein